MLADILEYDNVVNEFFLPVLKAKIDNPKEQLEKEKNDSYSSFRTHNWCQERINAIQEFITDVLCKKQ